MKVIYNKDSQRVPIKSWCENPEQGAIDQAINLSNLPFIFKHVALMPDTHQGYGMPIGGVIATKDVVIPNAVGVDIGCGMRALKTNLTDLSEEQLKTLMSKIRDTIPVGFDHHKTKQSWGGWLAAPIDIPIIRQELQAAQYQLGTLGGGNHFIEIQKGSDGHIWIMIHSGSRNFGYKIAKEYNKIAQQLCKQWYSNIPEYKGEDGLAFLPVDSFEGREYLEAMQFAMDFARENRTTMMHRVAECLPNDDCFEGILYDVHHNYASVENHYGQNVYVHRKGAILAREGYWGIIPGSQGSKSYIIKGLGNPESFMSCSHGAGRAMGRNEAMKKLNLEEEQEKMKGILHSVRSTEDLDESVGAYKNIDVVMEEQSDLVEIVTELTPLGVIKG